MSVCVVGARAGSMVLQSCAADRPPTCLTPPPRIFAVCVCGTRLLNSWPPNRFQSLLEDAAFGLELAEVEAEGELAAVLAQARASLQQLGAGLDRWELRMLLSGQYDEAGALLTITAGAGAGCRGWHSCGGHGHARLLSRARLALSTHACAALSYINNQAARTRRTGQRCWNACTAAGRASTGTA